MRTTDKGSVGVALATADLIQQGFNVAVPVNGASPYDLLVELNNQFWRVQVKYRKLNNAKRLHVQIRRTVLGGKLKLTHRTNTEYDVVCVYCPDVNECYYRLRGQESFKVADLSTLETTFPPTR